VPTRDPLTGAMLCNEWPRLVEEASFPRSNRASGAWAALIDIDHFKRFNMHNGHVAGDHVLAQLAGFLLSLENDEGMQVVRTGGQQFALVSRPEMGGTDQDSHATCERVLRWARDSLTPEQLNHCGDTHCVGPTRLTLSIALGRIEPGEDPVSLRERLSTTLTEAKRAGRDRVVSG
jgi:diguanylate cyclase (GGDEF)-like protein